MLAKIAEMQEPDRAMAKRIHAIVKANAPVLSPRTWYGMPAYAKDGKVVCFFQSAEKFKSRYATFGFSDEANLDEGAMWPTSFALKELTAAEEKKIGALVKKAVRSVGQLDALDHDRVARTVAGAALDKRDRIRDLETGRDPPEHRMQAVQPGRRLRRHDEELAPVRVRPRVRHRERTALPPCPSLISSSNW